MNHIEQTEYIQLLVEVQNNIKINEICRDLRQALNVINSDYQQIDWEDSAFLNRVLTDALTLIEEKQEAYAGC